MRVLLVAVLVYAVSCSEGSGNDGGPASPASVSATVEPSNSPALETVTVTFKTSAGDHVLAAEIANDPAERATGLMNRESLADDRGMLFVWPQDTKATFWMRNTLVPLTVAFIGADRTIVHFEDMEPLAEDRHASPQPYRFAVEANRGWFAERGIGLGDRVDIPAGAMAAE